MYIHTTKRFSVEGLPANEEDILVLYHDDLDGYASLFAAHRFIRDAYFYEAKSKIDYKSQCIQYGESAQNIYQELLTTEHPPRLVFVLDFSFSQAILDDLRMRMRVVVIDHHISSVKGLLPHPDNYLDTSRSGCGLTWDTLHPEFAPPWPIILAGDYDMWQFVYPETKPFSAIMNIHPNKRCPLFWDQLTIGSGKLLDELLNQGQALVQQNEVLIKNFIKGEKYKIVDFQGHWVICFNMPSQKPLTDELHSALNELGLADFTMSFFFESKGQVIFNLRSQGDMNVSTIARKFSGGGHVNAASFKLPFDEGLQLLQGFYART